MKRIVRGLFEEREKKESGTTMDFFDEDSLFKIIRLMQQYSIDENVVWKSKTVRTIPNFLDRLAYQLPQGSIKNYYDLSQLADLFKKLNLNEFLSTMELFSNTLYEECDDLSMQSYPHFYLFVEELNNLLAIKTIPFRMEYNSESGKILMDRINSPIEEKNKRQVYDLLQDTKFKDVNDHFTNSLISFAKREYPGSVEEAYLAIEKYLKSVINNHKLDAPKAYAEFKKIFNVERGLFKIHHQKIKDRIDFVYTIRSEIKSHSDKQLFDRKDFLEETARFQLNEVMNLIILLDSFKIK